jgi:ribonuclease VapC
MFLDASSIIAIVGDEEDAAELIAKVKASTKPIFYSSLSLFEAVMGFARKKTILTHGVQVPTPPHIIDQCQAVIDNFLETIAARELTIGDGMHRKAIEAARTYGRAVAHPARLNFGDCFAYACAKSYRLPLLFKGNDFSQTDIEAA